MLSAQCKRVHVCACMRFSACHLHPHVHMHQLQLWNVRGQLFIVHTYMRYFDAQCDATFAINNTHQTGGHKSFLISLWLLLLLCRPGSTGAACTGACHVTKCRACYYSEEVHNCPVGCRYACGEDPNHKCFKKWSKCVKDGLGNMVSLMYRSVHMCYIRMCMCCVYASWPGLMVVEVHLIASDQNFSHSPSVCL